MTIMAIAIGRSPTTENRGPMIEPKYQDSWHNVTLIQGSQYESSARLLQALKTCEPDLQVSHLSSLRRRLDGGA